VLLGECDHRPPHGIGYSGGACGMGKSFKFKYFKHLDEKIFLLVIGLELVKTLIVPNPIDILVLVGLILIFWGWFGDDFI
jgi:hypothetical protein